MAEHYEMLYNRVIAAKQSGKLVRVKTNVMVNPDLKKLAEIEAAFQEKSLSDVVEEGLFLLIKNSSNSYPH